MNLSCSEAMLDACWRLWVLAAGPQQVWVVLGVHFGALLGAISHKFVSLALSHVCSGVFIVLGLLDPCRAVWNTKPNPT